MKFHMSPQELEWFQGVLERLLLVVHKDGAERDMLRSLARLRYKFTPNASYVSLTVKERMFLSKVIAFRVGQASGLEIVAGEAELLRGLLNKMSVSSVA